MAGIKRHQKVRGVFENGELRFTEPVEVQGSWKVEIIFLEQEESEEDIFESDPHRPEAHSLPDRLEEHHRQLDPAGPRVTPF